LTNKYTYQQYAQDVIDGKVSTCENVRLACRRFVQLQQKKEYDFVESAANHAVDFLHLCKHHKGELSGQTLKLEPWQQFLVASIFGFYYAGTRKRLVKTAYVEVPRKNGKTMLASAIALYMLVADGEAGAEVYSAATKRDQAKICFENAVQMVKKSPELSEHVTVRRNLITVEETASSFVPLGRDADGMDGLNIHCAIVDELHAHRTRDTWDVLNTGTGSRVNPLVMAITTAGYNRHSVCYAMHDYTERINSGLTDDDSFFGVIYSIDADDDPHSIESWRKANPNYGVSALHSKLSTASKQAENMPSSYNSFVRLHLNVWTESETRFIESAVWSACDIEPINERDFYGKKCWAGLDLSSTRDITAFVLVFKNSDGTFSVLPRFWLPADSVAERVRSDKVPYDVWIRDGLIESSEGNVLDYDFVLDRIVKDSELFDIQNIAYDRWGASRMRLDMQDNGLPIVEFGQGFASMSPPTKELERLTLGKKLNHGGNAVLNWMIANTVIRMDPSGNKKPDKERSIEKIDGIVALIMALAMADTAETKNESIYESRGIRII